MTSPKHIWSDPAELGQAAAPASGEFDASVAAAIADLRTAHGHANDSCQSAGNTPAELDRLRDSWRELLPGVNRRGFLQLSGAAAVFALASCTKDPDTLAPYAVQPEGSVLGMPRLFASTVRDSGRPVPVLVKTYDGRPIKLEGNPDCPVGRGAADLGTQAALLNLYDPDRWQRGPSGPDKTGKGLAALRWNDLDAAVGASLKTGGIGLITGPINGPSRMQLLADLKSAFGDRLAHVVVDPLDRGHAAAFRARAFGATTGRAEPRLDRANLLLCLGSDFLASEGLAGQVQYGVFRRGADASGPGRVIAVESVLSQTGAVADVRVRCDLAQTAAFAWQVASRVAKALGVALPTGLSVEPLTGLTPIALADDKQVATITTDCRAFGLAAPLSTKTSTSIDPIDYTALELLRAHRTKTFSLVYVGGATHDDPASWPLAAAAHFLNAVLGNEGVSIEPAAPALAPVAGAFEALLAACDAGRIATLIIADANPVHADPSCAARLAKVPRIVALSDRCDETAALAHYLAPTLHDLENWGDAELAAGVLSLQQPAIRPLWDARAWEESLIALTVAALGDAAPASFRQALQATPADRSDAESVITKVQLWHPALLGVQSWRGYVRQVWSQSVRTRSGTLATAEAFWTASLMRGVRELSAPAPAPAAFTGTGLGAISAAKSTGLRLHVSASRTLRDGTHANNPWLQETPDPVSRITWDGYAAIAPADAAANALSDGDVVTLSITDSATQSATLAVHIQDGQLAGTVEVFLGWGRATGRAGLVAESGRADSDNPTKPFNAFALTRRSGQAVTLARTGARYALANVQGHHRMEGRDIARETVLGAPGQGAHGPTLWTVNGKPNANLDIHGKSQPVLGRRFGLVIDMDACTGCNACVVACSAENNVPVVGRDEVRKGRIMHWLRIDRYYTSAAKADGAVDRDDVAVIHQPLMCQHCEKAPCEAVCPANATMHNDEGVNVQIYNRCIGTRYCANNCPYKARRFNWYEYSAYRMGPQGTAGVAKPMGRIVKNLTTEMRTSAAAEMTDLPLQLVLNPDVTVRSRGVMEKCNLCLQRTRDLKTAEKRSGTRADASSVVSACAQTCPTRAITFGDLNDPASAVSRAAAKADHAGGYKLLEPLNTRPAVTYLPKVRLRPLNAADLADPNHHGSDHGHGAHAPDAKGHGL